MNDYSGRFKILIEHRIHGLLFFYTKGFEDLIYLYYSYSFKTFTLLYYYRMFQILSKKGNDYVLTKEECVLVEVPELNNYKVSIDTWDGSQFYSEYAKEIENDDDDYNYNDMDMIYEEDQSMNDDSIKEIYSPSKANKNDKMDVNVINEETEEKEKSTILDEDVEMKENKEEEEEENIDDEMIEKKSNVSSIESEIEEEEAINIEEYYIDTVDNDYDSDMDVQKCKSFEEDNKLEEVINHIKQFAINSSYTIDDHFLYRYECIICNVIYRHISAYIYNTFKGKYNEPYLARSINWFNCVTIPFQKLIWQPDRMFIKEIKIKLVIIINIQNK